LTTTQSILERVAAGDTAAVSECLDRYGDLVWSLARRYLRNATDAEDAVQDIFIDIWGSSARYDRNIASEVAFISTSARRRLIDKIRAAERRPLMDSSTTTGAPGTGRSSSSGRRHGSDHRRRVHAEMDRTPEGALPHTRLQPQRDPSASAALGTINASAEDSSTSVQLKIATTGDRGEIARMNANSVRDMDRLAELLADKPPPRWTPLMRRAQRIERNPGMRRDELIQAAATQVAFLRPSVGTRMPRPQGTPPARAKQWPFAGRLNQPLLPSQTGAQDSRPPG
jgi:RNA polymerase sigma factor (sigma-70 family)